MKWIQRFQLFRRFQQLTIPDLDRLMELAAFGTSADGDPVVTSHSALNIDTVHSIVKLISEDLAKLPLTLMEEIDGGRSRRRAVNHPVYPLLKVAANPVMSAFTWRQTALAHVLTWGNHYSQIIRDANGAPRELWPLDPSRMKVTFAGRERAYLYQTREGADVSLRQSEVFHVYGMGFDGLIGYNPISLALRDTLAATVQTDKYGRDFFAAPLPMVILKAPGGWASKDARDETARQWTEAIKNRRRVAAIDQGIEPDLSVQKMPNDAAQFLQTRRMNKEQLAMFYRVPKHKVQDTERATFTNIEHQALEYVQDCLSTWAVNLEQAIPMQLIAERNRSRYFARHNFYALLRGDSKAQAEFFRTMFNISVYSPNRIRELLEEDATEDGDRHYVAMNMIPVDKVDEFLASKATPLARMAALLEGEQVA